MMKIVRKIATFVVFLLLTAHFRGYSQMEPNFELYNNTNQTIYFYFGNSEVKGAFNDIKKIGLGKLEPKQYTKAGSLAAMSAVSPRNTILIVMIGSRSSIAPAYVYFFKPSAIGKKIYLSQNAGTSLEPQKGSFLGLGNKSKGGYSLKNNVTKDDILYGGVFSAAKTLGLPDRATDDWAKVEPYWVEEGAYHEMKP